MGYDEKEKLPLREHSLRLENRSRLTIGGVDDVLSFDEGSVVMSTVLGELSVRGEGLHIDRIALDVGELTVQGSVRELSYEEAAPEGSFWSRLFG